MQKLLILLFSFSFVSVFAQDKPAPPSSIDASDGTLIPSVMIEWQKLKPGETYKIARFKLKNHITPDTTFIVAAEDLEDAIYNDRYATPGIRYYYGVAVKRANSSWGNYSHLDIGFRPPKRTSAIALNPYTPINEELDGASNNFIWTATVDAEQYRFMIAEKDGHIFKGNKGLIGNVLLDTIITNNQLAIDVSPFGRIDAVWSVRALNRDSSASFFMNPVNIMLNPIEMLVGAFDKNDPDLKILKEKIIWDENGTLLIIEYELHNLSLKTSPTYSSVIVLFSENDSLEYEFDIKMKEESFNKMKRKSPKIGRLSLFMPKDKKGFLILLPIKEGVPEKGGKVIIEINSRE